MLTYYVLTFAISSVGMLPVIGGLPGTSGAGRPAEGIAFSLMAGHSVSSLLLTGLLSGRAGLRERVNSIVV